MVSDVLASIVIPTKNAGPEFRQTLDAIRRQTLKSEIFIVDSGSTDGTLQLATDFGAHITTIAPETFNHGATRNLGVGQTRTPFCIMLVQDAVPVGDEWLETLLSPFCDNRVVGVTAQQVPRADSNAVARWQVEYRIRFLGDRPRVQEVCDWEHFLDLGFQERLRLASFDNVCSGIRRSFWETHPFRPVSFAEDLDWGMHAIKAGFRLVYSPDAQVIHSHNRPAAYHLKRSYVSGRIVPGILEMNPLDNGVHTDAELLRSLGELCGEARTLVDDQVTDWRSFREYARFGIRDLLRTPIRLLQPNSAPSTPMRGNFYFILDQVLGPNEATAASLRSVVPAALAEAAGAFIAEYYNWCEANGTVSDGLRRLDQVLSKGV